MISAVVRARTLLALGIPNLVRVALYRVGLRTGLHPVCRLRAVAPNGPFFRWPVRGMPAGAEPRSEWRHCGSLFGHVKVLAGDAAPDWMTSMVTGRRSPGADCPWWKISDFDPAVGDIKAIWELSRFDWLLAMAQRAAAGDESEFRRLEAWLEDWARNNPPYLGPNWKCGQEASLRVLHLAAAVGMFGQVADTSAPLIDLVRLHLRRIAPTIQYAVAQDNNHGTSEAAALFVGGSLLLSAGHPEGEYWMQMGRRWLEDRAARLIAEDGSFSQYSLNYHRLMLETMSFTEAWRSSLGLPRFSDLFIGRCRVATGWLRAMIDLGSGDGPNIGANDGAHVLRWSDAPYRDFRPTLQLASALFTDVRAVEGEGSWNQPLRWLGVGLPGRIEPAPQSRVAEDGGFAWLRQGTAVALLRFPRFRFRPSQADLLHVDLWVSGRNLLRDAGTFSYNTDAALMDYFTGAAGHNTVQFDGREPMPRLGRFLFGAWPEASVIEPLAEDGQGSRMGAGYADRAGVRHDRLVELWPDRLRVTDTLSGFTDRAVLRWRLAPYDWVLDAGDRAAGVGTALRDMTLRVTATGRWESCRLVEGWESLKYQEKSVLPILEVCMGKPCTIISEFCWAT